MYSDLSSNLSSCNSVSYKPRLILLPSQVFTHMNLFLFWLIFLTNSKATIAAAVSSSLSIFKWNLLDLFEHLHKKELSFKKERYHLKNDKKWPCKPISFNLKNKKYHLKNYKKLLCKLISFNFKNENCYLKNDKNMIMYCRLIFVRIVLITLLWFIQVENVPRTRFILCLVPVNLICPKHIVKDPKPIL